jgi:histidyl-tRNA synthetase
MTQRKPSTGDRGIEESRHLELPRGFHDVMPDRMKTSRHVQEQWFRTCALAGYQAVEVPPVGFAATFTTGHHAAGERFYRFPDRRDRDLALVSDSLPAVLRLAAARHQHEQRLSYCCPIFRYERRPRRYFHHLGLMEVSDHPSSLSEQLRSSRRLAEILVDFLVPYCAPEFTITDPGLWRELIAQFLPEPKHAEYLNALRHIPPQARHDRLRDDGASEAVGTAARLVISGGTTTIVSDKASAHVTLLSSVSERILACRDLARALQRRGVEAHVDLNELHASEFHDGPSFLVRHGQGRLIGDGGCYGHFARTFLMREPAVTAHAAAIGLERLVDIVSEGELPNDRSADLAVLAAPEPEILKQAEYLTTSLRRAGVSVWDIVISRPISHHLRDLVDLAIPYSVRIGHRELSSASYSIRDRAGELHPVEQCHIAEWLISRIA